MVHGIEEAFDEIFLFFPFLFPFTPFLLDIDECAQQGGQYGNHCHLNTVCENTSGSYVCNCLPGFRRADKFNCIEINECLIGAHSCHENANCINTIGSYSCRCKSGYEGDGFQCKRKCVCCCCSNARNVHFYTLILSIFFF